MVVCAWCGESSSSAFSRRMLARRRDARCRSCMGAYEASERAAAARRAAALSEERPQELHECCGCSRTLPLSSFSRSQQERGRRGEARRCAECVSGVAHTSSSVVPLLLTEGWAGEPGAEGEANVEVELRRLKKIKWLRRRLVQLCTARGAKPTLLAFDRWLARAQLTQPAAAHADPLLPCRREADPGLVADLCRSGLEHEAASEIAGQLASEALQAAASLNQTALHIRSDGGGAPEEEVKLVWCGDVARLSANDTPRPYVEISRDHWRKLVALHDRWGSNTTDASQRKLLDPATARANGVEEASTASSGPLTAGDSARALLRRRVLCMLLRYEALGAHGYQAAVGSKAFEVLRSRLKVGGECFASPLNASFQRYCSAFPDVDAPFGSCGSFFNFEPQSGSFELNPPFVPELMLAAVEHAHVLLGAADTCDRPLSFVVVVPTWERLPFHRKLATSQWLASAPLFIAAEDHGYLDGAQHLRNPADRYRTSSFATTICVLQTRAGTREWPVCESFAAELEAAFRSALPTASAADQRRRKGGGDAVALLLERRAHASSSREPNRRNLPMTDGADSRGKTAERLAKKRTRPASRDCTT
eukprot:scaffold281217_cov23-Tisochrysis_lutea.AAC.1